MAAASPAQLIVLPETALPLFESESARFVSRRACGAGPAKRRRHADRAAHRLAGWRYYNSVASLGSAPSQRYHKVHLVPFGEYIPLKAVWGWVIEVLHIPLSDFTRGAVDQRPLAIGGQRVAANICYEDAFGEEIIRQLPEASVLVNVSNLAWFGDSFAPWQHAQMSQMRALETGRMMLRATNTGVTAIIDAKGRMLASLPLFTTGSLSGEIQGYAGSTPMCAGAMRRCWRCGACWEGQAVWLLIATMRLRRQALIRVALRPLRLASSNAASARASASFSSSSRLYSDRPPLQDSFCVTPGISSTLSGMLARRRRPVPARDPAGCRGTARRIRRRRGAR
jgi:apolipoprotein N-acyltransferase